MTATNERIDIPRPSRSPDPARARGRHRRRHEDAVIQAEVRRLARALAAAVESGKIKRLPAEFYATRDASASAAP